MATLLGGRGSFRRVDAFLTELEDLEVIKHQLVQDQQQEAARQKERDKEREARYAELLGQDLDQEKEVCEKEEVEVACEDAATVEIEPFGFPADGGEPLPSFEQLFDMYVNACT